MAAGVAGCSGSDGAGPPGGSRPPQYENLPSNPSAFSSLTFRQETLAATAASDGVDYRDDEFNAHWGLAEIKADAAYQRGYFGQGATVAIMDDGMDLNHPDLIGKTYSPWDVAARNTIVTEVEQFHGTYVGILVAGSRGNTAATFAAVTDSGLTIATKNSHGVAPQASL
ncbi:MAG: S8 family serine peptidase, partial [Betaproteobacteria bacterium]|nr:S8 family serine peptidase [Betaproteobacteria bacterium]